MNLLINASCSIGGGVQVCDSLIRSLGAFPQHAFVVCASGKVMESLQGNFVPSSNVKMLPCPPQGTFARILGRNPAMDRIVAENQIDAVFTVFGPPYWRPRVPHLCGFAIPHYVYPESEFLKKRSLKAKIRLFLMKAIQMRSFLTQTDALVSENPEVSARLERLYGVRHAYTVYNTFNPVFASPELWDRSLKLPEFDGTTLLTISSYYPHKNLEIMVPVARYLKQKYPDFKFRFVLSVRQEQFRADLSGLEEHFVFLGRVSISQCPYLYQQAQIMFLPTLLECFSAAWAEAMVMQVPILTSDLPFAHGICGNAARYVEPYSAKKTAEAIHELAQSPELCKKLIQNGNEALKQFTDAETRMRKIVSILENSANFRDEPLR